VKETSTALAFSEQNWGKCTGQYSISVAKRDHIALKEIVTLANVFITPTDMLSEDGSRQGNLMAEDLTVSADQRWAYVRPCYGLPITC